MIPVLAQNNWTHEEIRAVAIPDEKSACNFYDLPYEEYVKYSPAEALIKSKEDKKDRQLLSCLDNHNSFHYDQPEGYSFIPEWNMVCDRTVMVSNVQVALSIGKFFGASVFGIISDK